MENIGRAIRIFEALAASDPGSPRKTAAIADGHAVMGMAHERSAGDAPRGSEIATGHWRSARESYLKAGHLYEELERQGKLTPQTRKDLEEARLALRRADAALAPGEARR